MAVRDITSSGGSITGTQFNSFTGITSFRTISPTFVNRLKDVTGLRHIVNNLSIDSKVWARVGTVTGHQNGNIITYNNYPFDNQSIGFAHNSLPAMPSIADSITKVQAWTNPSRTDVSMPNFLFELGDLPKMLKRKGEKQRILDSHNSVAEKNFAWLNLLLDVQGIIHFSSIANGRAVELKSLHNGGLRRKRTVYSEAVSSTQTGITYNSIAGLITGFSTKDTKGKRWASVRWQPDDPGFKSDEDLVRTARLAIHGWDLSAPGIGAEIWEAIPWSWFADYFANVGTFFKATRNSVGGHATMGAVMTSIQTVQTQHVTGKPGAYTVNEGQTLYSTKERVPATAALTFTEPFLKAQQLTTLLGIGANLGNQGH
ncbi:MAG: putative maturation protein [Garnievirus montiscola]|uniref:Maturation protein n=1 Tax=Leviviridae sp. TaxID=2027243 RepID=A0ABY3SSQ8_9VIRU|nr:MAG: putative maturation protein [Leviviridae sp.]